MYTRQVFSLLVIAGLLFSACQKGSMNYTELIEKGEFRKAEKVIRALLSEADNLSPTERLNLSFEMERMDRIRKDFTVKPEDAYDYIRQYIPELSEDQIKKWEKSKALEYRIIDGKKFYFNNAARNLFRIDQECRKIWQDAHKNEPEREKFDLDGHIKEIVETANKTGSRYIEPKRIHIKYTLTVHPDAVPDGERIRCWIPFPRYLPGRQEDIYVFGTDPISSVIAGNEITKQRTIYMEKTAQSGKPTEFSLEYAYTSYGVYAKIDPEKVKPLSQPERFKHYLEEDSPHIVFTDKLKKLSDDIVGDEKNPYLIARKLFEWVDTNIPWASAREYSTIRNISDYCYSNMHGDCGIQTLLFITLCRMNGIPARWQSGWEFQPPDDSMHDWGMIYFEPYGWLPMDVTYGLRKSDDPEIKWFYLHGMDSYRLIFNDDYSCSLYPMKIYTRSETVDSQRGEVEWRGGNLYFDQWDWNMEWEIVDKLSAAR